MGELTAAIVHELAQPLTAVLVNAQAGLRALAAGQPDMDEMREILEDIAAADRRADQVIRNLRSLFKRGEPEHQPLQLNGLINDVVSVVVYDATLRDVSIVLDLAPDLPMVSGSRVQLQQVLLNLAMNAFEAMAEAVDRPRTLTLRTRTLDDKRVQIDVADTGRGIAPHVLDSIFKPFVTTKTEGMGMGLSLSHSIVREHGGDLRVENSADGGAVFHVVLPAVSHAGEGPASS
jgi:C4-dicarboxylate-specific signal transduction histidine kinase